MQRILLFSPIQCADNDIHDQTDRRRDSVDRGLLAAGFGFGIVLLILVFAAPADAAVADLLENVQRGERGEQQQEQALDGQYHISERGSG